MSDTKTDAAFLVFLINALAVGINVALYTGPLNAVCIVVNGAVAFLWGARVIVRANQEDPNA